MTSYPFGRVRVHRWFVTAAAATIDSERVRVGLGTERRDVWRPRAVTHAKAMGTLQTACGLGALWWPKMWDQPFGPNRLGSCPECSQIVLADSPGYGTTRC